MSREAFNFEKKAAKEEIDRIRLSLRYAKQEYNRAKRARKADLGRFALRQSGIFDEALKASNFEKQKKKNVVDQ